MAQVHRAVNESSGLQRPVALKRMLSHIAKSEDMVKSFVREARLASYLRHENVAQTYELGRVGDVYFIAMELVTGRNLREVLRHCGVTTGPMPVPIALNILNQICDALDYAHNLCDDGGEPLGIIHRDVSPSNVIVSENGVAKLIDFGIAKASGGGMQTMSGTLKGKFAYMAPEYIGGQLDARADLFAVGVIAHELLTNRPLFAGRDDIDTLTRVRTMEIAPPSKKNPLVPPEIDDIVMTALARDPDRRWQHATALRTALTTLTRRLGLVASNTGVVQWLDWAFSHRAKPSGRAAIDTDPDSISIDPSISIEPHTADLSASSQRMTVVKSIDRRSQIAGGGDPDGSAGGAGGRAPRGIDLEPPTETPVGTPSFAVMPGPASPAAIAELAQAAADAANRQPRAPQPVAPMASLPPYQGRVPASPPLAATSPSNAPSSPSPSGAPVLGLPTGNRTLLSTPGPQNRPPWPAVQGSQPMPPMASAPVGPGGLGDRTFLSSPAPAPQSYRVSPQPGVGRSQQSTPVTAPGVVAPGSGPNVAPGFSFQGPQGQRSAMAAHDLAQRGPATPPRSSDRAPGSRLVTVLLVLLAAAAAATVVYFVLPLLTSR
jgi:eukaryotic-like serine/threonine-protein kinase